MRRRLEFASLLLLICAVSFAQPTQPTQPVALKSVELEWDKVENAIRYEVKLTDTRSGQTHNYVSKSNQLSQKIPLGTYTLQVRCLDKDGVSYSPWSEGYTLEVANKKITPLHPPNNATLEADSAAKQTVEFEWTPVEKVKLYTLKVWSADKADKPWIFTGKEVRKKIDVPPGQTYHWQVSFESSGETDYVQQPEVYTFTLQGTQLLKPELKKGPKSLTWQNSPGAVNYQTHFFYRHLDETDWTSLREEKLSAPSLPIEKLKPGAYKLQVVATAPHRLRSDPGTIEFIIKPTKTELTQALKDAL